jgi:hypothetical protein
MIIGRATHDYWWRGTLTGSTQAALQAGTIDATTAIALVRAGAKVKVTRSLALTPYRKLVNVPA